jgi:hypothetical protein
MDEILKSLNANLTAQTELLRNLVYKDKVKTVSAFPTYTQLHGAQGIFSGPGLDRDVLTAHIRPMGMATVLPLLPSVDESPLYGTLTGYTATSGSEPVNPCDDAPVGYVKGCDLTAAFGRVVRDTQTIEIDKVMLRKNRGDFTDLVLRGRTLGLTDFVPRGLTDSDILNVVTKSEMVIAGVNLERRLVPMVWQGSPANNTAGGGYKEFPGLDSQIATGQIDALTATACPALDSDVKSFAYDLVGGTGRDIVEYMGMMEYYLGFNAQRMGLDPVQWVIVMRPQLWYELSRVWPCIYNTDGCRSQNNNSPIGIVQGDQMVALRDNMRQNHFIDINGKRFTVIEDDGIFEHTNINNANVPRGCYASSIYFVPLTVTGSFPVTYREYLDYRAAQSDIALLNGKEEFWTDDGMYMWAIENLNYCYKLKVKTEQRIILRTPQLAGKIQAVRYCPLQHVRDSDPSSPYFADGGVSARAATSQYAVWGSRGNQ